MFKVTPFKRDQLVLVVKLAMIAAVDCVESGTPTGGINFSERVRIAGSEAEARSLTWFERGALESTGMTLACLYAHLTDDGLSAGDALAITGFDKAIREWIELIWKDNGDTVRDKMKELGESGWQVKQAYTNYPDCDVHAAKFVDAMFGEYLKEVESPFSDVGVELDDGGYISFPDSDGTIRYRDSNGNCEDVRNPGDDGYDEWRDLFPDDAVYFQPEGAGDDGSTIKSHEVYRHLDNLIKAHPDEFILTFNDDDIEKPKFLDIENPDFGHPNNQPEG